MSPSSLDRHLQRRHRDYHAAATPAQQQAILRTILQRAWINPKKEIFRYLLLSSAPIPGLPVFRGHGCPHYEFICRSGQVIQNHRREKHQDQDGLWKRGRHCQRFYPTQAGSRLFKVSCSERSTGRVTPEVASLITPATIIRARVEQALQEGQAAAEQVDSQIPTIDPHPTAVSPWLELTRWPEYLRGQDRTAITLLGCLPDATAEPLLKQFTASIQRLINQAYCSIKEGHISEFDQIAINTFYHRPGIWNRQIQIHLRPATYRRYCQLVALHQMEIRSQQLVDLSTQTSDLESSQRAGQQKQTEELLDRACLTLSIALLDHTLKGDLFESTLVGFLAVLGIDLKQQTFLKPYSYTSYLSGLAVRQAEIGHIAHPADALEEMRERFLIFRVRAPFGWITRLRAYGKKVQNCTTSMGYIYWNNNDQTLSYKELQLSISGLRQFIVKQGWNFLKDPRTWATLLITGEWWLLDRVLETSWLRDKFLELRCIGQQDHVLWREGKVTSYQQDIDYFLERLLLLIHMTGSQPGRVTELLSLCHSNTRHGRHRTIFIEHRL
ncbi:hypothetical protein FE257_004361, partial [Aspergillus nanangensis]